MIQKGGSPIGYINAAELLPEDLLSEVRRYAEGMTIYIPRAVGRREWGTRTGSRDALDSRNEAIRRDYGDGADVETLSERYCLCPDSIRKILRKN